MKFNLYKRLRTIVFTAGLVSVSMYAMTNAGGPPAENTGAPGETTCGQSGCHNTSPITSGTGWNNITLSSTIPASGYVPGNSYSITLSSVQSGVNTFGFQAVVLDANGIQAGTLTGGAGCAVQTSNGKFYVNHTTGGTSGSGSKSWTFGWTAPSSSMGTLTIYVAHNAANGDNANTGDTIYTKAFTVYLTGTAPPTASIVADKTTICQGDTVHFTGSGLNNPTTYNWGFPGGTPGNSTLQNPVIVFSGSAGVKQVTLTTANANGNSAPVNVAITVNAAPTATTTPSGNKVSICGNDSINLTAASGNYSYLWTPGNETTQNIYVKNTGTYKVKLTNITTGCSKTSADVVITKRNLPVVTLTTSTDSICLGDSVTFSATANMSSYEFYRDTTKIVTTASASRKELVSSASAVYTVVAVDTNGCKSLASNGKSIAIQQPLPAPTVSCDSVTTSSIRFKWSAVTNADGYECSTDTGKTWFTPSSGATGLTHEISGLNGGTRINLRVRAVQSSGKCAKGNIGVTTCQSVGCAAVTLQLDFDSTVCNPTANDSGLVAVTNVNTNNFAVKVDQVNASGAVLSNVYPYSKATSYKLKLNGTTQVYYKFSVLDSNQVNCAVGTAIATFKGIVGPSGAPTLTFGKTVNVLCDRENGQFNFTKPSGTDQYEIFRNTTSLGKQTASSISIPAGVISNNDVIYVNAINNATGCARSSNSITITRKADPKAGFIANTDTTSTVQFNDTTTGAASWNWKFGDNGTAAIQNPSHTYATKGTFNVSLSVITADQCKSDTAVRQINAGHVGLAQIDGIKTIELYPNPVSSKLNLEITAFNRVDMIDLEIRDIQGKVILAVNNLKPSNANNHFEVNVADLDKAVYLAVIRIGNGTQAISFIKD